MPRGVQVNRQPAQPVRTTATWSDNSSSWMRFSTLLTRHSASQLSIFQFKTRETWPKPKFIQYLTIFPDSSHFFPNFGPLFPLNPSISGTIITGSGQTSDFSSRFVRNLGRSDRISSDLGWIWQDLTGSGKMSPHFEGFRWDRFHSKPTTTRQRPELTNLLMLRIGWGLKNHPPELLRVGCGLGKNPTRPTHGQPYWCHVKWYNLCYNSPTWQLTNMASCKW